MSSSPLPPVVFTLLSMCPSTGAARLDLDRAALSQSRLHKERTYTKLTTRADRAPVGRYCHRGRWTMPSDRRTVLALELPVRMHACRVLRMVSSRRRENGATQSRHDVIGDTRCAYVCMCLTFGSSEVAPNPLKVRLSCAPRLLPTSGKRRN